MLLRRLAFALLFVAAGAASAATTFVSPLDGAQAIGPMLLQVTTDAKNVDRVEFSVDGALAGVARTAPYRIAFDFGTALAARTVTATVWSNGFKSRESASVTTSGLTANDTINIDLVEVPLRIRARRAMKPGDLRLRENGVEQTIRDVKMERPAAHFAFIVDRSLSMGDGKLDAALAAVELGLTRLRPGDTASLVLFNHQVAKEREIARGDDLRRLVSEIVPSGGTSLRDAIASVSGAGRTYALVITDGGDRNSELTDDEALRRISNTKTIVSAVVLGSSHARFLDRVAQNTGGSVADATSATVATKLDELLADINSRYLVVYQSNATKSGWRSIDVRPRRGGIEILAARKGYYAK